LSADSIKNMTVTAGPFERASLIVFQFNKFGEFASSLQSFLSGPHAF